MMKFKYLLISLLSFFLCLISVSAGVCDGKTKHPDSGYCNLGITYQYPTKTTTDLYNNRYYKKNGSQGYLGYAYLASGNTFSGVDELSFCLDPSKTEPTNYNYGRELTIDFSDNFVTYDENIYKVYQYFVNNVASAKNNGTFNEENKQKYLAFTDIMLRIYTAAYGYDLGTAVTSPYYHYSILPYIIGDNKTKLLKEIGGAEKNLYENSNTSGTCKKTDSDLSEFNSGNCGTAWAKSKDVLDGEYSVKEYFDKVFNGDMLWKNPLTITPSVETDSNGNYVYSFKVEFKKDNYVYFGVYSSEKHYDYDIGYGNAFFDFIDFEVNGIKYDSSFGTKTIPKTNISATNGANDTITYKLTIPAEKYEQLKSAGKVDVKMIYKTYHPMSDENIFVNYINERKSGDSKDYQRMVVFTKYQKEKKVGLENELVSGCVQEGNIFKINGVQKSLEDYIFTCQCSNVNYNILNNTNKTIFDNAGCRKTTITVTSDLKSCDEDEDKKDYNITYKDEREINEYCGLTCIEDVKINSLVSKNQELSVKAGMHFNLPQYPELVSSKNCVVDVKYQEWQDDYKSLLSDMAYYYNLREKYSNAIQLPLGGSKDPGFFCDICGYAYSSTYYKSTLNNSTLRGDETTESFYLYACCDYGSPIGSKFREAKNNYNNTVENLKKHLNKLNTCTTTIKNMGLSNQEYYTFNQDMNFYYEQEYSKDSIGIKYNDERPYNVSDAELVFDNITDSNSATSGYDPGVRYYYNGINTSGEGVNTSVNDSGRSQYKRVVTYNYKDSRSNVYKYVDSYTGKINSVKSSLKNPIHLGYVYDIDASAKAKKDNENYYEITALGDENKIYNHFRDGKLVNGASSSLEDLKRYCEYETTNELMETVTVGDDSSKLNIVYRVVDPKNIDPNNRLLEDDKGFKNWKNHIDIKEEIENEDTFNPKNIEYSFELDSKTIKDIRQYNSSNIYSDFNLDCEEGNKCESDFVTTYAKKDDDGDMIGTGRNDWKD